MSNVQINDIITGFDKTSRSPYSLFAFIDVNDEKSPYDLPLSFEEDIVKMFQNTSSFILSEDSNNCNITNTDRNTYHDKLVQLNKLINECKNLGYSQEKQDECIYNKLLTSSTQDIINSLIQILKKINSNCLTKNVVAEEDLKQMCSSTTLFNDFSSSEINNNIDFIKKYSTIMVELKNIADNNIKNYINRCNKDPKLIDKYNEFQDLLSKALFEAKICKPCEPKYDTCLQVSEISNQIYNLKSDKQDLENEVTVLKTKNDKITQEYNDALISSDFVWDKSMSFRNGWIYWGIIVFLIIIIFVVGYFAFGRDRPTQSYGIQALR